MLRWTWNPEKAISLEVAHSKRMPWDWGDAVKEERRTGVMSHQTGITGRVPLRPDPAPPQGPISLAGA